MLGAVIADCEQYDLGRSTMNQAKIAEVIVFGYKNESVIASVLPNFLVRCSAQADEAHMGTIEIFNIEP